MPNPTAYGAAEEAAVADMEQGPPTEGDTQGGGGAALVVEALKTIGAFIQAQQQKGNPQAEALMQWFRQGLQMLAAGSGAKAEAAPEEMPPEAEAEAEAPAAGPARKPMAGKPIL